ncbi:MAG: M48 family metalloprotease [Desulfobacter sp.]|nr:M48 family metalloprotease [Desulfobacter sp.]
MIHLKPMACLSLALIFIFSPRAFAISIPDEQKMGTQFMEMIEEQDLILHDPVVVKMINTVGRHIVDILPAQPFHFDFNMINDNTFNAFAGPSANIFIHRGLINSLDTMDELAGIMAHEVAHAASRHVSQSIDRSKIVTIGSLAGILAGVLIGSSSSGDAGSALTIGAMAAGQSSMLSFTRDNETEADQKAVLFLEKTGYSPQGLLSALIKIREADYQGIEGIPDYFKTHPGTGSRIAHLAGILENYVPPGDKPSPPDNYDFRMVKYRTIGLYSDPKAYIDKIRLKLEKNPDSPALNYGLGLLYGRTNRLDLGIKYLDKALSTQIFDPMILLELGRLHIRAEHYSKALSILEGVTHDKIMGNLAVYYRSVAQIKTGQLDAAQKGLTQILNLKQPEFARANFHMANIMSQRQHSPMSHYYLGLYYTATKDFKNATRHLTRAIETLDDPKVKQEAQARLQEVRGKIKKMARQKS